jgi:hypothetical protein
VVLSINGTAIKKNGTAVDYYSQNHEKGYQQVVHTYVFTLRGQKTIMAKEEPQAKVGAGGKRPANQMGSQPQQYYYPAHYYHHHLNCGNPQYHFYPFTLPFTSQPGPLLLPSKKPEKKVNTTRKEPKRPPHCSVCVDNNGIYSDDCPGRFKKVNCSFFNQDGSRKQCAGCKDIRCDGGNELKHDRCRLNNGKNIRLCEILQHCFPPPPLPPPPPPLHTIFPSKTTFRWSQDSDTRIITADFRELKKLRKADLECLLDLFELTDAAVVSKGLAKETKLSLNTGSSPVEYDHIIKTLRETQEYNEVKDVALIDNVKQFIEGDEVQPNKKHTLESFLKYHENSQGGSGSKLTCKNDGSEEILYLIDYPLATFFKLQQNFMGQFIIPHILPGGDECLTNCVSIHCIIFSYHMFVTNINILVIQSSARDLAGMGPLLYMGVGGAHTKFHEDGSGTVDSGHLCLCGFNEVIILRRLDGTRRTNAASILGISLEKRPHVLDTSNKDFSWPTVAKIEELKAQG